LAFFDRKGNLIYSNCIIVGFRELLHIDHYFTPFCINTSFGNFVFKRKTKIIRFNLNLQLLVILRLSNAF
jgi:hypothetical protein